MREAVVKKIGGLEGWKIGKWRVGRLKNGKWHFGRIQYAPTSKNWMKKGKN